MMNNSTNDSERLPRSEIPDPLVCPFENCRAEVFKRESGYRGHMHGKHGVLYENKVLTPALRRMRELDVNDARKLRPWQRLAVAKHVLLGYSLVKAAELMGKSPHALRDAFRSKAGQEYAKLIAEQTEPKMMVQNLLETDLMSKYLDWQQAWVWAMENRDYDAIHRMAKDIGMKPVLGDEKAQLPTSITINLSSGDLESKPVLTSYEVISDDAGDDDEDL